MVDNIQDYMQQLGRGARAASRVLALSSTGQKNDALLAIADSLRASRSELLAANRQDVELAEKNGLETALVDRLVLNDARIDAMIEGLEQVAALADPVGEIAELHFRPSGIQVGKMRVPLGVVGIIYESRPNVTIDAASLCLKSGNAAILRGGSEAAHSNAAIAHCISQGVKQVGLPAATVQVVNTTDRAAVGHLITMPEFVDVIVPRGGKGLIERISREARVPVIKHLDGNCHVYIHSAADTDMALNIAVNAKTQRYGTCNTTESLLIDASRAEQLLPLLATEYLQRGVELRLCERALALLQQLPEFSGSELIVAASDSDWGEEFLAPILAVKIVDDYAAAVAHIAVYSSQHTESIVTNDHQVAMRFLREVDSSSVMINASTRFADGFEYGLGAEIGISTDKIHARGPVGLEGLTSQKYIVLGNGHIRQ